MLSRKENDKRLTDNPFVKRDEVGGSIVPEDGWLLLDGDAFYTLSGVQLTFLGN